MNFITLSVIGGIVSARYAIYKEITNQTASGINNKAILRRLGKNLLNLGIVVILLNLTAIAYVYFDLNFLLTDIQRAVGAEKPQVTIVMWFGSLALLLLAEVVVIAKYALDKNWAWRVALMIFVIDVITALAVVYLYFQDASKYGYLPFG